MVDLKTSLCSAVRRAQENFSSFALACHSFVAFSRAIPSTSENLGTRPLPKSPQDPLRPGAGTVEHLGFLTPIAAPSGLSSSGIHIQTFPSHQWHTEIEDSEDEQVPRQSGLPLSNTVSKLAACLDISKLKHKGRCTDIDTDTDRTMAPD